MKETEKIRSILQRAVAFLVLSFLLIIHALQITHHHSCPSSHVHAGCADHGDHESHSQHSHDEHGDSACPICDYMIYKQCSLALCPFIVAFSPFDYSAARIKSIKQKHFVRFKPRIFINKGPPRLLASR